LILYPLTALFASARQIESVYHTLKEDGTTGRETGRLMTFAEFNALIGADEKNVLTERFAYEDNSV
jgi:2-methylisocitrate lyase-like PEP mutase family enzyme